MNCYWRWPKRWLHHFVKSPGQRGGHRPGRGSRPRDDASLRPRALHDDRGTRPMLQLSVTKMTQKLARFRQPAKPGDEIVLYCMGFGPVTPAIPAGQLVGEAPLLDAPAGGIGHDMLSIP
jgi:hypothetical protein